MILIYCTCPNTLRSTVWNAQISLPVHRLRVDPVSAVRFTKWDRIGFEEGSFAFRIRHDRPRAFFCGNLDKERETGMQKFNDVTRAAIIGWSNGVELAEVQLTIQVNRGACVLVAIAEWGVCALLLASDAPLRPLHDGCRVLLGVAVSLKPDVFEFEATDRVVGGRNHLGDRRRGVDLADECVAVLVGRTGLVKLARFLALSLIETEPSGRA